MRYLPHTETDVREMLDAIGIASLDELFRSIPDGLKLNRPLDLPKALSEPELLDELSRLARANTVDGYTSFTGAGIYRHYGPSMVNHVLTRSEFYTAYTPYQPEVSQGTLQAIFEYQTLISLLLECDVTNASMYDGATGCAEAVLMAQRVGRKRNKVLMARSVHPEFRRVTRTYLVNTPEDIVEIGYGGDGRLDVAALKAELDKDCAAVVIGQPNYFGVVEDVAALAELAHEAGALLVTTFSEPLAYGLLAGPGAQGADIVCGEGQSFLGGMNFGGPSLGIFSTRETFIRQMPGRVAGMTTDADQRCGFVLTLSTREQHIRREKATSNICTNQGLMALSALVYLCLMGKQGLRKLANTNLSKAEYAKAQIAALDGFEAAFNGPTFNEFVIKTKRPADEILGELYAEKVLPGVTLAADYPELESHLLINVTEMHKKADIDRLVALLEKSGRA